MKICKQCQATNQDGAQFCLKCGAKFGVQMARLEALLNGRYRIKHFLAKGGMGAVYLAEDIQLFDRLCVVKEMLPFYTTPEDKLDAEKKFRREAELLASLNHPNIPQIYAYFVEQDHYYLVMQHVKGKDLESRMRLQGGYLPESEVLEYARQLARVLRYIGEHQPPIIHRDIKPANIILEETTGHVKLVDFGIAKMEIGGDNTKTVAMGTTGYAPPEQYQGNVLPATDIYALGATLHHLLTGRDPRQEAPFDFPPVRQIMPTVSEQFAAVIGRILVRSVDERPFADQLVHELEHIGRVGNSQQIGTGPFVLRSGVQVETPQELGSVIDQHWEDSTFHLYQGHFESWFQAHNRHDLANRTAQIRQNSSNQDVGVETLLRTLAPTAPFPTLAISQSILDFGPVERGSTATQPLTIENQGRGYLVGEIKPLVNWVMVSTTTIGCKKEEPQTVQVTVESDQLAEGVVQAPILALTSNGGEQNVAGQLLISWQPQLSVTENRLDFGEVLVEEQGKIVHSTLTLVNSGGAVLSGQLFPPVPWLQLSQTAFHLASGQILTITATADTGQIPPLQTQSLMLTAQLTNGSQEIPVHIGIKKAWYDTSSRVTRWLAYGVIILLGIVSWGYGWGRLANHLTQEVQLRNGSDWAWMIAALLLPLGLYYGSQQLRPQIDELERYFQPGNMLPAPPSPTFDQTKQIVLVIFWLLLGVMMGGGQEFARQSSILGGKLLYGIIAGGVIITGLLLKTIGIGRWPLLAAGFGLLGTVATIGTQTIPPVWAVVGLLWGMMLAPIGLAERLQWLLAHGLRPFFIFIMTWGGIIMATMFFIFIASSRSVSWFMLMISTLIMFLGGLGGAWLGYWVIVPTGQPWQAQLRLNQPFLLLATAVSLTTFALTWILDRAVNGAGYWFAFGMHAVVLGGFVWVIYKRPQRIIPLYQRMSARLGQKLQQNNTVSNYLPTLEQADANQPFLNLSLPLALSTVAAMTALFSMLVTFGFYSVLVLVITAVLFIAVAHLRH